MPVTVKPKSSKMSKGSGNGTTVDCKAGRNAAEDCNSAATASTAVTSISTSSSSAISEDSEFYEVKKCCTPRGCKFTESDDVFLEPNEFIKVVCNNEECSQSGWMHAECFEEWEEHVLVYLKSCGRARSWNDKQRMQNLWTKKGYDLAYKACDCLCGRGHLKKDLDYVSVKDDQEEGKKRNNRKHDKFLPTITTKSQPIPVSGGGVVRPRVQIRNRSTSFSSTGSSPPTSLSPPGFSPTETCRSLDRHQDLKFEYSLTQEQAAAGNIFHHRHDLQAFKKLPAHKRNPYHIKMEDEGPYGNDETRCFVLASLSTRRITTIPCVVCGQDLKIFDKYPLCDGTLFLTPQRYISDISLQYHGHTQYMNAVCMLCAEGLYTELTCKQCQRPWNGSALQVGTMYSYDIFAASPCCMRRLQCKNCGRVAVGAGQKLPFYSQFSRAHACCNCGATGYHFVKPLNEIFYIHRV